jgi:hypothetical protein
MGPVSNGSKFYGHGSDSSMPRGGLISDSKGNLYGITTAAGAYGQETVFELVHKGGTKCSKKMICSFAGGNDGGFPYASLVF